jgi:hypothetical protein
MAGASHKSDQSTTSRTAKQKCPGCKRVFNDPSEYRATVKEFEARLDKMYQNLSRKDKKQMRAIERSIKTKNRIALQQLKNKYQKHERALHEKLRDQKREGKTNYDEKLSQFKRNHQLSIQRTRELYESQMLYAQKERESQFNLQLKEILENYSALSSKYQAELEGVRKVQDEYSNAMRKADLEITRLKVEIAKANSDPQMGKLIVQLRERDSLIGNLRKRIAELETKPPITAQVIEKESEVATPLTSTLVQAFSSAAQSDSLEGSSNHNEIGDKLVPIERPSKVSEKDDLREQFIKAVKEINRTRKRDQYDNALNQDEESTGNDKMQTINSAEAQADQDNANSTSRTGRILKWFS